MVMALARQGKISVGVIVACCLLHACDGYDHKLIEPPAQEMTSPVSGGGGGGGEPKGSGGRGNDPDGTGGTPATQPRCGNGVLDDGELCDTSIAEDKPGACPTKCEDAAKCVPRGVSGTRCQAQCVVLTPTCMGGDGCCSGNCTQDNDSDCSPLCGDGMVQASKGETCDPGTGEEDDAGMMSAPKGVPCKTQADCDDHDACTTDVLTGSEQNCNADCSHAPITDAMNGDGCCPKDNPDVNANNDTDCQPMCGNNVHEGDEECDGGDGCTTDCKLKNTPEQMECLSKFVRNSDACETCLCLNCTKQVLDCRSSGSASRDTQCSNVIECASDKNCAGSVCLCGSYYDPNNALACLAGQDGPCKSEVQMAAGTTDPIAIDGQRQDNTTAVGRAAIVSECGLKQCAMVCP